MSADPLKLYIENLGLRSSLFFRSQLCGPWGLHQKQTEEMLFHYLVRGNCLLRAGQVDSVALELKAGDLVMFPKGAPHWVASDAYTEYVETERVCYTVERDKFRYLEGPGPESVFLCGAFSISSRHCEALLSSLPEVLHIRLGDEPKHAWIKSTLGLVEAETFEGGHGGQGRMTHLLDTLFELIIKWYLEESNSIEVGLLAGLRDPQIGKVLNEVIGDLKADWSLHTMSQKAGMSRSGFVEKFTGVIGESPVAFVRKERLKKAEHMLSATSCTVKQVAFATGFASPLAFSKSFERAFGCKPSDYRRLNGRFGN